MKCFLGVLLLLLIPALLWCQPSDQQTDAAFPSSSSKDVTIYDSLACFNGINVSGGYYFFDMKGNVVATRQAFLSVPLDSHRYAGTLSQSFVMFNDTNVVWTLPFPAHHDVLLDVDSNIAFLAGPMYDEEYKTRFEVLVTVSDKGEILKKQNFKDMIPEVKKYLPENRDSILRRNHAFLADHIPDRLEIIDSYYFHINSVQLVPPNRLEKKDSAFAHGHFLISDFTNNFMAIIDRIDFHIRWFYYQGESALGQHNAQMLPDGRIIYLINNIRSEGESDYHSEVRILDPITKQVVWKYAGTPSTRFHSPVRGGCQYLDNGNVLITVNNKSKNILDGYVIEVTPAGKVVWKWKPEKLYLLPDKVADPFYRIERIFPASTKGKGPTTHVRH